MALSNSNMKTKYHCLSVEQQEWSKDNFLWKVCFEERPVDQEQDCCCIGLYSRLEFTTYEKHKYKVGEDYEINI